MEESISLDKDSQTKFKRKVNKLKRDIKSGKVIVKKKRFRKQTGGEKRNRGVIYLGHIPHGFYEDEMRAFFKQFGIVTRVKVCRSQKTGRSKGYGYVEFLHPEVAQVAADSMNNYLMYSRKLVAEYIPPEKQKRLFLNRTVNPDKPPALKRRLKEQRKKNRNIDVAKHEEQCKKTVKSLKGKLKKLRELGIDHTIQPINAPEGITLSLDNEEKNTESEKDYYYETVDSDIDIRVEATPKRKRRTSTRNVAQKDKRATAKTSIPGEAKKTLSKTKKGVAQVKKRKT